ncbi:MAG: SUMF1/EgtB/PvdO family nonheme iron enzyme [Gemmataceae bacterium]
MTELDALLAAVVADPHDKARWQVLADWLEEFDDPLRSELLRLHRRLQATCLNPAHPDRPRWHERIVALLADGVEPCVPRRTVEVPGAPPLTFAFIPPGMFLLGSPSDEEHRFSDEARHLVTIADGYWLGVAPVTQAQWYAMTGDRPWACGGDDYPVEGVSWEAARAFVEQLSEKTGQRFRLPTEAEWEHACRAGTTTAFHVGDDLSVEQANYYEYIPVRRPRDEVRPATLTVAGTFPPNPWGLFDMHGNVWEWCTDPDTGYGMTYSLDPREPPLPGDGLLRGGSWSDGARFCRSAYRRLYDPGNHLDDVGCRVVLCGE